jgi:small subunit ribosomal protein S2
MERMPKAMFVVDTKKEETAVKEAKRLHIPIIGLIDTNSDPDLVAYPIPGNDDATKAIRLIASLMADTVLEGRKKFLSYLSQEGVKVEGKKSEEGEEPVLLPEEEAKIKEIAEIVETSEPVDADGKPAKKGHAKTVSDDRSRIRKKV